MRDDDDAFDAFIGLKKKDGEWVDIWGNPLGVNYIQN